MTDTKTKIDYSGEIEFVDLMNMYHIYYKKHNNIKGNKTFFDNLHEIREFKEDMINSEKNKYFDKYNEIKNSELLKIHNQLYHAKINGTYQFSSTNIIYLIKHLVFLNIDITQIEIEKELYK
jgi:hypothetical protein